MSTSRILGTRPSRWAAVPVAAAMVAGVGWYTHSAATVAEAETAAGETQAAEQLQQLSAEATPLASGLDSPTSIDAPDDDSDRLLITERPGTVRAYHPDTGLSDAALLDIGDRVEDGFLEQGLLGITTPPDFAENPMVYVVYTAQSAGDDVTLSRFTLDSPDQQSIDPGTEEVLLTQDHSVSPSHNGGQLAFGPDGHLYMSVGDGGFPADPINAGQDRGSLLGTILRLDVSAECADSYCIPEDNPFVDDPESLDEIWHYGLRNPWRFSFDRADGSMWIGDVGEGTWEEVNHAAPGEGGLNFGWSCMEGPDVFDEEQCFAEETLTDPAFYYGRTDGCSVTGGYTYRGEQFADIADGVYVAADWCNGNTWGIVPQDGGFVAEQIGGLPFQIHSFGEGVDGELYAVTGAPAQLYAISFTQ